MTVNLPKTNQTGKNEWADVEDNDVALKAAIEELQTEVAAISGITWYTPKVIATEESRTNTAFGTLATADEIKSVVVPENGLLYVSYMALWQESVNNAARAAIFIGANQLQGPQDGFSPSVGQAEAKISGEINAPKFLSTWGAGLRSDSFASGSPQTFVTTGQPVGNFRGEVVPGGPLAITVAAGTYDISIRFKASSGTVKASSRKLRAWTLGS